MRTAEATLNSSLSSDGRNSAVVAAAAVRSWNQSVSIIALRCNALVVRFAITARFTWS